MKKHILWLLLISIIASNVCSAQLTANAATLYKLPLRERIIYVQDGELDGVVEKIEAERQQKIQLLIDNYKREDIHYTETEIEKQMNGLESAFKIASSIFEIVPIYGDTTSKILNIGAEIAGGIKKSDADKTQEMLQQMMNRIDTRFDIVDEKLNSISSEFHRLEETNKYYELLNSFKTDLSGFREKFERKLPTDCAYYNYTEWKTRLRNAYSKVQECYEVPEKMVYLHERYEKLFLCASEITIVDSYIEENAPDTDDYSVAKNYYDYLVLANATDMLDCISKEDITWETVCYINDLYNTYVFAQHALGLSYVYRAELIDKNAPDSQFIHSDFKETGMDTITNFFETYTADIEAVKCELTEDIAYVLALDLSYTYAANSNNKSSYVNVPYYSIIDIDTANETLTKNNQVCKGSTIFLNKLPYSLNTVCDFSKISYMVTDGKTLASVDNNGTISVIGDGGNFTVSMYYQDRTVYSMDFVIETNPFSGGNGTAEFPYLVSTYEDLSNIRNYRDKHFILVDDIDLSAKETTYVSDNDYHNFVAIPEFSGVLDGAGHTISGMRHRMVTTGNISSANVFYLGLIEQNSGTIKNLTIQDFDLYQSHDEPGKNRTAYVGMVCGANSQTGVIEHVNVKNSKIYYWLGGETDHNTALVGGGICGVDHGTIQKCKVTGTSIDVRGKCSNSEKITDVYVGGITGYTYGVISDCFSSINNLSLFSHCGCTTGWFSWSGYAYAYSGGVVGVAQNGSSLTRCLVAGNLQPVDIGGGWPERMTTHKGDIYGVQRQASITDSYVYVGSYSKLDLSQYNQFTKNGWAQNENGEPYFAKEDGKAPSSYQIYLPKKIESTSISLESLPMYEYAISECGENPSTWQKTSNFTNLMPGTPYKIYVRCAETNTASVSLPASPITVFTDKNMAATPSAPVVKSKNETSVVLEKTDGYEYSVDGAIWQDSNIFDNLDENTEYTFYQRAAETDTTYASTSSAGTDVKTDRVIKTTIVNIDNNVGNNTCTIDYEMTESDLSKSPVFYIAFYGNNNVLEKVTIKNDNIIASDSFVIDVPKGSVKGKVMLWGSNLFPLCHADDCEID